jgi:hypothetical protein
MTSKDGAARGNSRVKCKVNFKYDVALDDDIGVVRK